MVMVAGMRCTSSVRPGATYSAATSSSNRISGGGGGGCASGAGCSSEVTRWRRGGRARGGGQRRGRCRVEASSSGAAEACIPGLILPEDAVASHTRMGTSRKQNEDRMSVQVSDDSASEGDVCAVLSVFDGHGGFATAQWLEDNFVKLLGAEWSEKEPDYALTSAFLAADKKLLSHKSGMFGMGERGYGGAKCGSTAATAVIYAEDAVEGKGQDGGTIAKLICANAGDARTILVKKDGSVEQMSEDHVPDNPDERTRIERNNPTPKMPLVRFVGGTWRIGGLLALSRALGDAYLKSSGLFEGIGGADDDYSSGFGLIAQPFIESCTITDDDLFLVIASDGLNSNPERGGGGGWDNEQVASYLTKNCDKMSIETLAKGLAENAVKAGSTDDVSIILVDLRRLMCSS